MKNPYHIDSFFLNIETKYPTTIHPVIGKMSQEARESLTVLQFAEIAFPDIALICNNRFESQKTALNQKLGFEFSTEGKLRIVTKEYVATQYYLTTKFALWVLGYIDLTILPLIDRFKIFQSTETNLGESMFWDIMSSYKNGEFKDSISQIEEAFTKGLRDIKIELTDNPNEDFKKLWQKIEPNLTYSLPKFIIKLNKEREYLQFLKMELSKFIAPQQGETIEKSKKESDLGEGKANILAIGKPKIKRKQNDNITSLSQDQTVILINYLMKENIILSNDTEYQTQANIAKAFQAVTGYGHDNLRQKLSKVQDLKDNGKQDLREIKKKLEKILSLITKDLGTN